MTKHQASIVVLGAGLQGCSVSLELAGRGLDVVLLDQDPRPMNRASLRNEGKIHLGLLYAMDPSLASARLQLRGALWFQRLLERWAGSRAGDIRRSTPFHYLVARDSLLTPEQLARHYAEVQTIYDEHRAADPGLDYLGTRPDRLARRLADDELARYVDPQWFLGGFASAELAIDTAQLAELLRDAVDAAPGVRFLPRHRVQAVERVRNGFRVEGHGPDGPWRLAAEQVVNATWESRMAIDRTVGLRHPSGWVHRLKYRVIVKIPKRLHRAPSVTMVLGRFGDVVIRPDGTAYLSWYPVGLGGWSHEIQPPASWDAVCRGDVGDEAHDLAARVIEAIGDWFPGIGESEPILVDAGVIVAYGRTDVDDAASGLHGRTQFGVTSVDGYHSVDPGKLTTAPLFAQSVADRVAGCVGVS